jgi:predicted enzyme related to lactoylglutathione lyase
MSLIGQLPLAAIKLSCKDVDSSKRFYRDVVGLKLIDIETNENASSSNGNGKNARRRENETGDGSSDVHFDLGNIRLTLAQSSLAGATKSDAKTATQLAPDVGCGQFLFVVESAIDKVYADLAKRGVKFKSKKIFEDQSGKTVWFSDPDGNVIYLWQPPRRDSKSYKDVEAVVRHYELVTRALADLREGEEEEERLAPREEAQIAAGK